MWVILNYFPHSPVHVFGVFNSEHEAREYAEQQGMAIGENAYEVQHVRNVDPTDDQLLEALGPCGK